MSGRKNAWCALSEVMSSLLLFTLCTVAAVGCGESSQASRADKNVKVKPAEKVAQTRVVADVEGRVISDDEASLRAAILLKNSDLDRLNHKIALKEMLRDSILNRLQVTENANALIVVLPPEPPLDPENATKDELDAAAKQAALAKKVAEEASLKKAELSKNAAQTKVELKAVDAELASIAAEIAVADQELEDLTKQLNDLLTTP